MSVEIYDGPFENEPSGFFSTPRKNLGNKLFTYAGARIIADLLDCNLIVPEKPLVRRELFDWSYQTEIFPFAGINTRKNLNGSPRYLDDSDIINRGTIENFLIDNDGRPIIVMSYFSKYQYMKPYKNWIIEYYKKLIKPKRRDNSIVIMLRDSRDDARFKLNHDYYLDILEKETFDTLYVSYDHIYKHQELFHKIKKYNPIYLETDILTLFREITSFDKIIGCQGTFSFWACWLSNASKIYWPIPEDGPNSNNSTFGGAVNLLVDDEDRYEVVNLNR